MFGLRNLIIARFQSFQEFATSQISSYILYHALKNDEKSDKLFTETCPNTFLMSKIKNKSYIIVTPLRTEIQTRTGYDDVLAVYKLKKL